MTDLVPRPAPTGRSNLRPQFCSCLAGLLIVVRLAIPGALQAADLPVEYQVKAAFLLNFTKFVEWPAATFAQANSPITLCIVGEDPFGPTLEQTVQGETIGGRKVLVRRGATDPSAKSCQVVFVSRSEHDIPRLLAAVGPGVLTVSEGETFLKEGGMIAFAIENRRVRFDINRSAAASAGLKISSRLLSVARLVAE